MFQLPLQWKIALAAASWTSTSSGNRRAVTRAMGTGHSHSPDHRLFKATAVSPPVFSTNRVANAHASHGRIATCLEGDIHAHAARPYYRM